MTNLKDKFTAISTEQETRQRKEKMLGSIADMLVAKNIDINEIGDIKRVLV